MITAPPSVIVMTPDQLRDMLTEFKEEIISTLKPEAAAPRFLRSVEIAKALRLDPRSCAEKIRTGVRNGRITRHDTPGGRYAHGHPVYDFREAKAYLLGE